MVPVLNVFLLICLFKTPQSIIEILKSSWMFLEIAVLVIKRHDWYINGWEIDANNSVQNWIVRGFIEYAIENGTF
jgi:hypothetical protein